jgi:hypothetical protein
MFSKFCVGDEVLHNGKEVKVYAIQGYSVLDYTTISYLVSDSLTWVSEIDLEEVV